MDFITPFNLVQTTSPLVQCITNFVTVNDCANILLACRASPTLCQALEEAPEAVAHAKALVINMGTMDLMDSMFATAKAANLSNVPVILDPVGVGGTTLRRTTATQLLREIRFTAIRGNASEIRYLAGQQTLGSGVDVAIGDEITQDNLPQSIQMAAELSRQTGSIIAISGVLDIISDGTQTAVLRNGCATMSRITGSGCMLTTLIGAFCGALPTDPFSATVSAMATMGVCGELAEVKRLQNATGNATFRTDLIDSVFNLTPTQLEKGIHCELYT